jgi:hypothetical protein
MNESPDPPEDLRRSPLHIREHTYFLDCEGERGFADGAAQDAPLYVQVCLDCIDDDDRDVRDEGGKNDDSRM